MGEAAKGALRRGRERLLGGVCSGLAEAWHLDVLLVRVVAVLLLLVPPVGPLVGLAYVILWLAMPPPDGWEGSGPPLDARVRMVASELRQDIRATFGQAQPPADPGNGTPSPTSGPSPSSPSSGPWRPGSFQPRSNAGLWVGALLVLLGIYLLGQNLGLFAGFRWDIFWPVVIIALGLLILLRRVR